MSKPVLFPPDVYASALVDSVHRERPGMRVPGLLRNLDTEVRLEAVPLASAQEERERAKAWARIAEYWRRRALQI